MAVDSSSARVPILSESVTLYCGPTTTFAAGDCGATQSLDEAKNNIVAYAGSTIDETRNNINSSPAGGVIVTANQQIDNAKNNINAFVGRQLDEIKNNFYASPAGAAVEQASRQVDEAKNNISAYVSQQLDETKNNVNASPVGGAIAAINTVTDESANNARARPAEGSLLPIRAHPFYHQSPRHARACLRGRPHRSGHDPPVLRDPEWRSADGHWRGITPGWQRCVPHG